jgi:carbon monoxide dehydrogenase subunit G
VRLTHEFTVPAPVAETWHAFDDIESVAGCFPGATVTSVEGDTFEGSCKVRLGPIALVYNGSGTFLDKDAAARTMRISAQGKDKRGNGTAGAEVVATMTEVADGRTQVNVVTDLSITGKPAQFGRGIIEEVSNKLLGQFVDCLASTVGTPEQPGPSPAPPGESPPAEEQPRPVPDHAPQSDALDLGATLIPVLLRTYGKQLAAVLVGLVLLRWLLRRRR